MTGKFSVEAQFGVKDRMSPKISKMEKRIQRFTRRSIKSLKKMDRAFGAIGKGIKRAGLGIAAGVTAAAFAIKNIVSTGAEFEQAITNVGAVSLKSRGQIAELEKEAINLGASTKFTATEVAGAMEIMAKAGFSTTEILAGVPGVLDAAAASGSEIAEVADVVSSALKGMGLETSEATRVSDVLALASSKTNSTIVSLGESLKNVASTARQLKVPLEDVVAGVALLQDVGLDASVAGSAMNVMLTKLAKPPAAVAKQMKKFGISFKDAKGDMLPFQEVIGNISKAAKASGGNLDQVAFLADLVGLRGQKAASNLAKLFETGKLEELTRQLNDAEGSARKMAELRMDTLTGDLLKLEAAADGVKIELFGIKSPLRDVVQGMTEWIGQNKELIVSGVTDFMKDIKDNGDQIVATVKNIGIGLAVFFGMQAAVKAAQLAIIAFNATVAIGKGIVIAFNFSVKAGKFVMDLYAASIWLTRRAMVAMGLSSVVTATKMSTLNTALNSSKIGGVLNGIKGKLGKAGVLGAVFAVTAGLTTMLLKFTGLDKKLEGFGAFLAGPKGGELGVSKTRGFGPAGPKKEPAVVGDFAKEAAARQLAASRKAQLANLPEAFRAEASAQLVSPQERVAREVSESINTNREQVEIKVSADAGSSAEVTRKPKRGGLKIQESGAT